MGAGLGASSITQPVYQSSVGFFVVAPTADRLSALEADNLVRGRISTYAMLVTSDRFLEQVVAATGQGLTTQQAASNISASGDPATLILSVKVNDVNAKRAQATASAISTHFGKMVNDLEGRTGTTKSETVLNVVSGPSLSANPVSPRKTLNFGIGLLLGLAVGIGLAIAVERADRSIRTVKQLVTNTTVPVLATLPKDKAVHNAAGLMARQTNTLLVEAVRGLRTNIQFHSKTQDFRILAVTASQTGDGATTTALTLAKVMSETGLRVLLVDANLRGPQLAGKMHLESTPGLVEVLAGQSDVVSAIQKSANTHLDVLAAGQPTERPSELLGSGIARLLQELRKLYDMIIIDTAALSTWTDASLVAAAADGAIVVVRHGKTTLEVMAEGMQALESVGAVVLGSVLNVHPINRSRGHAVLAAETRQSETVGPVDTKPDDAGQGASSAPQPGSDGDVVARRAAVNKK